jgi:tight adherence protein B
MLPEFYLLLLLAFVAMVGVAIMAFGLVNVLNSSADVNERLETFAFIPDEAKRATFNRNRAWLMRFRVRLNSMLSFFSSEAMNLKLLSANWPITEMEYILLRITGTLLAFLVGWLLFRNLLPGVGFAILAYLLPDILLKRAIHNRRQKFARQLVDVLVLVKGAVRSGYSFLQALDIVVQEMRAPASEEFRRVRREVALGLPLSQALNNLHARMLNADLYLTVTAVNINSQVGGNLATMLEAVTTTIRERVRLFSEINALTSQQRYSAYLLTLLPVIVTAILFVLNADYMSKLFEPGPILCVPIGAVIMVLLGNVVIRYMARIDV